MSNSLNHIIFANAARLYSLGGFRNIRRCSIGLPQTNFAVLVARYQHDLDL